MLHDETHLHCFFNDIREQQQYIPLKRLNQSKVNSNKPSNYIRHTFETLVVMHYPGKKVVNKSMQQLCIFRILNVVITTCILHMKH